jgi:transposase
MLWRAYTTESVMNEPGLVTISMNELQRVKIIEAVVEGRLSGVRAAGQLGLSERQVSRLRRRFEASGAAGLVSARRGRPSNRQLPVNVRARVIAIIRERYADFGPTLAREKLYECHGIRLAKETVRRLMTDAGLWIPRKQRPPKVYQPRARRALVHTDDHALAVDVRDLQVDDFRHAQTGCVGNHQDGPMLQAGDRVEEGGDLLQAEDNRQADRLPGQWEILVTPVTFERHAIEKAQCTDRRAETGGCQLARFAEIDEPGPDLFGTQQFRRTAEVSGETGYLNQIGLLGIICKVADPHVMQHALAQWCHGEPPGSSRWNAQPGVHILLLAIPVTASPGLSAGPTS